MKYLPIAAMLLVATALPAQTQWTVDACYDYAEQHSIAIKRAEIARDNQELSLKTAKLSFLPDLNAGLGQSFSFGRATGADNVISSQSQASTSFNVQSSMPLFTGLRIYNQIEANKLNLQASVEDLNRAKEDLRLNIVGFYLQILYNKDLVTIAEEQVSISAAQVTRSEQLVANGKLSESELYQNRAQLAVDEQSLTTANNNLRLAIVDLCQLINQPDVDNFDVAPISTDINAFALALVAPRSAYEQSLGLRPSIKASQYRVKEGQRNVNIAKSQLYPQLNLSGGYSTSYYKILNIASPDFGTQLNNNGSEFVSLSLSIPIFNRMGTINNIKQAKLSAQLNEWTLAETEQQLFKEIQTAYYNAIGARDRFTSASKTIEAAQIAFDFEQTKYDNGRSTAFEFDNAKVRLEKARAEESQAKFEYLFRIKIYDFYNGKPLKL